MIVGSLQNPKTHYQFTDGLAAISRALRWLEDQKEISLGEYPIQDRDMYAIISKNKTKPPAKGIPETHDNCLDIHAVLHGHGELIEITPRELLKVSKEYDAEKDVTLYHRGPVTTSVLLTPGIFVICAPGDAHTPGLMIGNKPTENIKLVIKIHTKLIPRQTYAHRR